MERNIICQGLSNNGAYFNTGQIFQISVIDFSINMGVRLIEHIKVDIR